MKKLTLLALSLFLLGATSSPAQSVYKPPGLIQRTWTTLTKPFAPNPNKPHKFKPGKAVPNTYY